MQYRKKPIVIEAMQFTDDESATAIWRWAGNAYVIVADNNLSIDIVTLEGTMTAFRGDWIIRGVKGEFYPCKPDIFAATYEPAEECVGQFGDEPVTPWLPGVTPGRFNKETWAFQWDGSAASARELIAWVKTFSDMPAALLDPPGKMMIDGYTVRLGDYVIRNMEDYPHIVEKSAFEATYKLA